MIKSKLTGKNIIFISVLLFLFLPIIEDLTHFIYTKPLDGVIEKVRSPEFSDTAWFGRSFQEKKEKYLNQEFGFRNFLVRLHNQICYSLFKEAYAKWVVVGKENYMYESGYIESYFGRNFIDDNYVKWKTTELKNLQDTLKKKNKSLLVVIAPGKASFYPEYIPDEYCYGKGRTFYESFCENLTASGVEYVDFCQWFISMKNKSRYPLFPQYGVHWSIYGSAIALDSLLKKIEAMRNVDLPDMKITGYEFPDTLRHPDYDVYKGMNLLLKPKTFQMAYPVIKVKDDSTKTKLSVLVIADSYYWNIYGLGVTDIAFTNNRFWFYNEQAYSSSGETKVLDLNLKEELDKTDMVVILSRDADIGRLGWGFIENCDTLFFQKKKIK